MAAVGRFHGVQVAPRTQASQNSGRPTNAGLNETHLPTLTVELTHGASTVTLWRNPPSSVYPWRELVTYTGRVPGTFQVPGLGSHVFSSQ